ncbi:nitronate monooxygenase [Corynebacterium halotolerans]|uniref:Propionate 3-nitronate monooxygenase n=1 Tax=Corynebacterium halotolerans YIM 70093 = DSM 44683 TaxID=1121362 RepID=M1P5M4_9CORY|nr:nitronate monooxygenase [Corynebacterium halotolerans]AGF71946.1 oxidoreductase [Corynebacterium halotolerans YIM 70093 = DSM 44683]
MSILSALDVPVLVAPMAGGPSSPALVTAAARAGSLGFLATGAAPVDTLVGQLREAGAEGLRYGVNLFTAQQPFDSLEHVRKLVGELAGEFTSRGLEVPEVPEVDYSNGFDAKLDAVLAAARDGHGPAVLSSTFGPLTAGEIGRLHEVGVEAWITVTTPADALEAQRRGADALVVQGPAAGGHRSTWGVEEIPDERPLAGLVDAVVSAGVTVPLVAAGGLRTAGDVRAALELPGVRAVSCGSAFLLADEAGTSAANRELLVRGGRTVAGRAFSGRVARGLATGFTRDHPGIGPVYPYLAPLLAPLRATGDERYAYCLVGTDVEKLTGGSTAEILAGLWPAA